VKGDKLQDNLMHIGAMRERLTLEQPVRTPDGAGGATVAWQPVTEVWAHVRPISGDERLRHDQVAGRLTHEVWIRHRTGIAPAMRFTQGARIYEIVAILELGRRSRLTCLCEERSL
jgi:SPP1 family predicted phage head-tail adaptor